MDVSIFKDPWILGMIVVATVSIVGLAKAGRNSRTSALRKSQPLHPARYIFPCNPHSANYVRAYYFHLAWL